MNWKKEIDEMTQRRKLALGQGGDQAVAKHHAKGRLTIRERIDKLIDQNTFEEIGPIAGAANYDENGNLESFDPANFVLGFGKVSGRRIVVGGEDFTMRGGAPSPAGLRKSVYAEELSSYLKVPLARFLEGGGGSVANPNNAGPRTVGSPVFSAPRFKIIADILGKVPVVSAALGPVAGFPAGRLVSSHFSVMVKNSAQVMVGGPALVERALGQNLTKEELGGWKVHSKSGLVDNLAETEEQALEMMRTFLSYLPQNVWELRERTASFDSKDRREDELLSIVPRDKRKPFNIRKIIGLV